MKPFSRLALFLARRLPRGYWPLIRFAAARDPALQDYPIPLASIPGTSIRADLRETVYMNFLRDGCIPGQRGHDLMFGRLIAAGDTVFDVGANVGYTMLLFASRAGPAGKVAVFEPGRRAFAGLARNAQALANVSLIHEAASDHVGEAIFYETEMSDISSLEPVAGAVEFAVPITTLDIVAGREGRPDFVKIDVEGHEPAVLRGMAGLFAGERPPIVLFEALDAAARADCLAVLDKLAPAARRFRLGRDGSLSPDLEGPGSNDYLVLPAWAEPRLGAA